MIDAARAVAIPADQKILHILPQEFIIDAQEGIREPIGMSGVRLEAKVHIVTGAESAAQNIVKCVQRCGLEVEDIVLEQLASSYAVLTEDEKELGVCLVDIGGGTTDIAVFSRRRDPPHRGDPDRRRPGHQRHRAEPAHADAVRRGNQDQVRLRAVAARERRTRPSRCRASATARRAASRARRSPRWSSRATRSSSCWCATSCARSGFEESIAAGIVLTGGSAKMEGAIELAEEIFHAPVRLGLPQGVSGLVDVVRNPIHSTGVGLLLFGRENYVRRGARRAGRERHAQRGGPDEGVVPGQFLRCGWQ